MSQGQLDSAACIATFSNRLARVAQAVRVPAVTDCRKWSHRTVKDVLQWGKTVLTERSNMPQCRLFFSGVFFFN